MATNPGAAEWAGARGEKWRDHVAGSEAMLEPINQPLIDALALDAPYRIADLACGGGGTTLEIQRRAPTGSVVHGFDISPALIEVARKRASAILFTVADLSSASPDRPFDRLFSRFGMMFFDQPQAAFTNLARWLAPNGRFAFAVWGPQSENPWLTIPREVVTRIVEVQTPDPEVPGPFRYAQIDKLLTLLERAGFCDLDVSEWHGKLPLGGALSSARAAEFALAAFASFGDLLAASGPDAVAEGRRSLAERLSSYETNGVVRMDAGVHIVTGTRAERSG